MVRTLPEETAASHERNRHADLREMWVLPMKGTTMKNLILAAVLCLTGCAALKDAGKQVFIWTHDGIDDWLEGQTNVNTATEGPLATNATEAATEPAGSTPQPATTYAKPTSLSVDWTAKTLTPTGMSAGEIGEMLIIGRMADGRTGALDYPAWDAAAGLWRISMMTPVPGSDPTAELHAGSRTNAVIFKQRL
jgi:hypothetical protein